MSETLVAYFSASGVTKRLAEKIADAAQADIFEIVPEQPYTAADLDWMDKTSRSSIEMNDKSSRPVIAGTCPNMATYDTILLGFPIWWYVAPTIINTFLEAHDMAGKKIICFATSGGSGMGKTVKGLEVSAPQATFAGGEVLNGASASKIEAFLKKYL